MSKFNKEQKIEIYRKWNRKWKDEKISISQLSKTYKTNVANLNYMLRLIDMYGINVLDGLIRFILRNLKNKQLSRLFSVPSYMYKYH